MSNQMKPLLRMQQLLQLVVSMRRTVTRTFLLRNSLPRTPLLLPVVKPHLMGHKVRLTPLQVIRTVLLQMENRALRHLHHHLPTRIPPYRRRSLPCRLHLTLTTINLEGTQLRRPEGLRSSLQSRPHLRPLLKHRMAREVRAE